jgi:hypothetical protein
MGLDVRDRPAELGGATVSGAPRRAPLVTGSSGLLEKDAIAAMAHIAGGGLVDNLPRVLGRPTPDDRSA